jgi:hypothetical protein
MSTTDMVEMARAIANEMGVPFDDLTEMNAAVQVALIRDRIARKVIALREELYGLQGPRATQRIAA